MKLISIFWVFVFSATFLFAQNTKELNRDLPSGVVFTPLKNIPKKEKLLQIPTSLNLGSFRRGEHGRIILPLKIAQGWYIYSIFQDPEIVLPSKIEFTQTLLKLESLSYETSPVVEKSELGISLKKQKNNPVFYQNFSIEKNHPFAKKSFKLLFFFQLCSEKICFPPEKKEITVNYLVEKGEVRQDFSFANRQIDANPNLIGFQNLANKGLLGFILFAALSGILAWISPCVFAVFPLLVLFFSNSNSGKNPFFQLFFFTLGIALSFTLLGSLVSIFLGATSLIELASSGWTYLFLSSFFLLFALNFLGLASPKIPAVFSRWQDWLLLKGQTAQKYWFLKILLAGTLFTLTTLSCTFPFIGTLLVASSYGYWFYPILGLMIFSFVFIFPLLLFSIFPQKLRFSQKIFAAKNFWTRNIQFTLGLLSLVAAVRFLNIAAEVFERSFFSRNSVLLFWMLSLLTWLIFLFFPLYKKKSWQESWQAVFKPTIGRVIASLFCLFSILYLAQGLGDKSLGGTIDAQLPSAKNGYLKHKNFVSREELESLIWHNSIEKAFLVARAENKAIFVDFSGKSCTNCRWMEQNIFPTKEVFTKFKNHFILVRLYTDIGEDSKKNLALQQNRFGNVALPLYVLLSKDDLILKQKAGLLKKEKFIAFLTL